MIMSLFFWILLACLALASVWLSGHFVRSRTVSTKLLAVASKEFFENAEKLLKTPEELPDSVLEALETMSQSIDNGHGSRALLDSLRMANSDANTEESPSELQRDFEGMRPELVEFFGLAVAGWLNFVTHRHFIIQQKINMELARMAVKHHHSGIDQREAGISALARFGRDGVAC